MNIRYCQQEHRGSRTAPPNPLRIDSPNRKISPEGRIDAPQEKRIRHHRGTVTSAQKPRRILATSSQLHLTDHRPSRLLRKRGDGLSRKDAQHWRAGTMSAVLRLDSCAYIGRTRPPGPIPAALMCFQGDHVGNAR